MDLPTISAWGVLREKDEAAICGDHRRRAILYALAALATVIVPVATITSGSTRRGSISAVTNIGRGVSANASRTSSCRDRARHGYGPMGILDRRRTIAPIASGSGGSSTF
jgi:hypothetical protein